MRARMLQFVAPRRVEIAETDIPEPETDQMVVRTLYSGISSGTELLAYRGEIDPDVPLDERIGSLGGSFSYPFSYGYSCVGVVERSESSLAPGTLVFVLHPHQDRFVCNVDDAVVLSGIDPRAATLFPMVETAFQIALDAGDVLDENVVVMGLGAVGFLTALLLQRAGARVMGVEPSTSRRELAQELDVEVVPPDRGAAAVEEASNGRGVSLVVEVSGNPEALGQALTFLAHEGTALVASWYGTKPVTLPLGAEFHRRRLTICSTQVSTIPGRLSAQWTIERRRNQVARLLSELPLKRLATHEFAFDDAAQAYAALDRGDEAVVHVALDYGEG